MPQDWSHRHVIYSNPDTREEAAAKGTLEEWTKNANDPRFVLALEKKSEKRQKAAAAAQDIEASTEAAAARKVALRPRTGEREEEEAKTAGPRPETELTATGATSWAA